MGGAAVSPAVEPPDRFARVLTALLLPALQQPDPKPADAPSVLETAITLRDIEIGQLLEKLEAKVPYTVAGRVTVRVQLAVPLDQVATAASYRFTGTVASPELRLEGLTIRDLFTEVNYQNGKLTLTALRGRIPHRDGTVGEFRGTAAAAVDPAGDVTADLALDRIPIDQVARAFPGLGVEVGGLVTGKATFRVPYEKLDDPATWAATATVRSDAITVAGRTGKGVTLTVTAEKGTVRLTDTTATVEGVPVAAEGTLALAGAFKYEAAVRTKPTQAADLRRLIPEAELPVPLEGLLETETRVSGTLSPFAMSASGTVRATKLAIGKTPANHLELTWEYTPERVAVSDLKAELFGGTLSGSADIPSDPQKAGTFRLEFQNLDAAAAAALVPDFPVRITGRVSGKVAGGLPPAKPGEPRVATADVDLTAPKLTVQGIPAERLVGKFGIEQGAFRYELEGRTLGGSFEVRGRYPGQGKKPPAAPPPKEKDRGSLRIENIDLSRLGELGFNSVAPLAGRLDLTLDYANDLSEGTGRVFVRGIRWGTARYSTELSGVVVMREGVVEIADLGGPFAGGQFRGRARVFVRTPARNFFVITVDRADARRLFAAAPDLAEQVAGEVSVVVRGRVGPEMRGTGTVSLHRGSAFGIGVNELRVPFDWSTSAAGYGRLTVRDVGAQAGAGLIQGRATLDWWGPANLLTGQFQFSNVRLVAVAPGLGESSLFGGGRLTGRLDLGGTNVRSADDVTATLTAVLTNTSVREIPVLSSLFPYLAPRGLVRPFQSGDVRGRLARGVFRIDRLVLVSPNAQLFAEGSVTTAGRLDLNVVAHTGQFGPESRLLRVFGLRIPAIGPIPVGLIRDVSDFLSNRTVRLTVTGTVRAPVVRVNTAALLTEEAVRFFLTRYVVPAEAAGALGIGSGLGGILGGTSGSMNGRR